MEAAVKVSMFLSLFISFCTIIIAGDDECSYSSCREGVPEIQFPFSLEGHQDRSCGYPGFSLSCSKSNETVLDLGPSGKFTVRHIDYERQELRIHDQDDCLPRRLINLDLSGTPFKYYYYKNFDFYNCSSNFSSVHWNPISCLSKPNHSVYAVAPLPFFGARAPFIFGTCEMFATARVPLWEGIDGVWYLTGVNDDLHLLWDAPNCGESCVARGGTCRFKNRDMNEIGCYNLPRRGLSRTAKYVLGVGIGGPGLLFLLLTGCYVSGRLKSVNHGNNLRHTELSSSVSPHPSVFIAGLEEAVIQSYPKTVLGESRRLVKPEDNICSICLSEYQAKDILKTIPDCKHCFHAACIDQWLRRNVTCPLCRNAAMPPPPV